MRAEGLHAAANPGFYSAEGDTEIVGDFLVSLSGEKGELYGLALVRIQRGEGFENLAAAFVLSEEIVSLKTSGRFCQ